MTDVIERYHMQLTERDAKIAALSSEIDRLNDKVRKLNSGIAEALVMTDAFPNWLIALQEGRADISQKRLDLINLGDYLRKAQRG